MGRASEPTKNYNPLSFEDAMKENMMSPKYTVASNEEE
jgi:hypothetical protein|tara:strand:- start:405 stop:518 length:114 start_codon:yes stop_codon:yes gene_type:complete